MRGLGIREASLLAGAATCTACQLVAGIENRTADPIVDASDAAAAGDAAPANNVDASGPWGCLQLPDEPLDPNLRVTVTVQAFDALQNATAAGFVDGGSDLTTLSAAWFPGVSVRSCYLRDPGCVATGSAPVVTNDAGEAVFHLTGDFAGFFELTRPDLVPWSVFPQNLLAGQASTYLPAWGLSPGGFRLLASAITPTAVSLDTDGGLGHAFVQVFDCQDHQAPGVQLAYSGVGSETVVWYMKNGIPSTSATQTDAYGIGGVVNVPVGSLTVTAVVAEGHDALGNAEVLVRPGALTLAFIRVRSH